MGTEVFLEQMTEKLPVDVAMTYNGGAYKTGGFFTTYTGRRINPIDPDPSVIDITDISQALSNVCRYNGHCRSFFSVAQHCVLVSYDCDPNDALTGLLHDASEAYLNDIVRPVKNTEAMESYRAIEKNLEAAIAVRFGTSFPMPESVRISDDRVLISEASVLFRPTPPWVLDAIERKYNGAIPMKINEFWTPPVAKAKFMRRFLELSGFNFQPVTNEELDAVE